MTFSDETLSLLVLVSIALGVLVLFIQVLSSPGHRRGGRTAQRSRWAAGDQGRAIDHLRDVSDQLSESHNRLREALGGTIQRVGLVRYDAFEDMGGRLSFSLALLDAHGDGVVVTSINGRQDTRCYAKPVTTGTSSFNLSDEEVEAIAQAMGSPSAVTA